MHNRAVSRTAAGTVSSYVMATVSLKNGCQHFSYVHSSRKHWKCKYCAMNDVFPCWYDIKYSFFANTSTGCFIISVTHLIANKILEYNAK